VAVIYVIRLGYCSYWDVTESEYALVLREMLARGNFFVLTAFGKVWFDKEPLMFWLTAPLVKILGFNPGTIRLFPMIFSLLSVGMTYRLAKLFFKPRVAVWSALVFGAMFIQLIISRIFVMDTAVLFFFLMGVECLLRYFYIKAESKLIYIFSAAMAFSILLKGLAAPAQMFLVVLFFVLQKKFRNLLLEPWKHYLGAGLLFILILAPWYGAQFYYYGTEYFNVHFLHFHLARATQVVDGQTGPVYYYLIAVLFLMFPFGIFLPGVIKHLWKNRDEKMMGFLGFSILAIFLMFTYFKTKLPHYIYAILPLLAVAFIDFFMNAQKKKRYFIAYAFQYLLVALMMVNFIWHGESKFVSLHIYFWMMTGIAVLGLIPVAWAWFKKDHENTLQAILFHALAIYFVFIVLLLPAAEDQFKYAHDLGKATQTYPQALVYSHFPGQPYNGYLYTDGKLTNLSDDNLLKQLNGPNQIVAVITPDFYKKLRPGQVKVLYDKIDLIIVYKNGKIKS
jgi:4-amino-4-deoxy-L-arabinose transferase-like glycosyltransferase